MRNINKLMAVFAVTFFSTNYIIPSFAAEVAGKGPLLDKSKFSIGVGISSNSVSGPIDDEVGFQVYGAYDLTKVNLMEGVNSSVEFGYMDYGFRRNNSGGIWTTYVVDGAISGNLGWVARLGLDLGDDSGFMLGAGAGYAINEKMNLRLEYVVRDEVDSLQLNYLYHM